MGGKELTRHQLLKMLINKTKFEIDSTNFIQLFGKNKASLNNEQLPKFACRHLRATPYESTEKRIELSYLDGSLLCHCGTCQLGYRIKAYNLDDTKWGAQQEDRVLAEPFIHPDGLMQAFDLTELPVQIGFRRNLGIGEDKSCCWASGVALDSDRFPWGVDNNERLSFRIMEGYSFFASCSYCDIAYNVEPMTLSGPRFHHELTHLGEEGGCSILVNLAKGYVTLGSSHCRANQGPVEHFF